MPVLMTTDIPASRADVEAVSAETGAHDNPPAGLIVHLITETAAGVHVVDVWETAEDYRRFTDEQLAPAMAKVLPQRGISMDGPPPAANISEAFDVIRGR
ncbi:hypothetical protein ACSMXN_23295 [Jatrophihabitans sp. DSM 45814]